MRNNYRGLLVAVIFLSVSVGMQLSDLVRGTSHEWIRFGVMVAMTGWITALLWRKMRLLPPDSPRPTKPLQIVLGLALGMVFSALYVADRFLWK
jgi:hypothetical protein